MANDWLLLSGDARRIAPPTDRGRWPTAAPTAAAAAPEVSIASVDRHVQPLPPTYDTDAVGRRALTGWRSGGPRGSFIAVMFRFRSRIVWLLAAGERRVAIHLDAVVAPLLRFESTP
jgi:hypothetical protein